MIMDKIKIYLTLTMILYEMNLASYIIPYQVE
jgi:hypothetical protein